MIINGEMKNKLQYEQTQNRETILFSKLFQVPYKNYAERFLKHRLVATYKQTQALVLAKFLIFLVYFRFNETKG